MLLWYFRGRLRKGVGYQREIMSIKLVKFCRIVPKCPEFWNMKWNNHRNVWIRRKDAAIQKMLRHTMFKIRSCIIVGHVCLTCKSHVWLANVMQMRSRNVTKLAEWFCNVVLQSGIKIGRRLLYRLTELQDIKHTDRRSRPDGPCCRRVCEIWSSFPKLKQNVTAVHPRLLLDSWLLLSSPHQSKS